jgi:hypothetical protein
MSGNISFNPYATTSPVNTFAAAAGTQGYVQGLALDDPSSRMWLEGGTLDVNESLTMWGGIPVSIEINQLTTGSEGLGAAVKRSTSQGNTLGWSVFNQAASMVITPGNVVPQAAIGNYVSYYRNTTNARIPVKCDPTLVAALTAGELINGASLFWSVTLYWLTLVSTGSNFALPTTTMLRSVQTNSKVVTYTSASSVTWGLGDAAIIQI